MANNTFSDFIPSREWEDACIKPPAPAICVRQRAILLLLMVSAAFTGHSFLPGLILLGVILLTGQASPGIMCLFFNMNILISWTCPPLMDYFEGIRTNPQIQLYIS